MDVVRDKEQSFDQMKFDLAKAKRHRGGRRLEDLAQDARRRGRKPTTDVDPCPYDPMQLDAAKVQRMSDEECQKLMKAGKCFGCKDTGHRYRKCPERLKHQDKDKPETPKPRPKPRARAADTSMSIEEMSSEEEEEGTSVAADAPPAYSRQSLAAAIKKLSMEDREELLDMVALDSDQDF